MGAQQPYLYSAASQSNSRFPEPRFDPKAVTRASWEPKPRRPKQDGPLISFNRHPDAHMVLSYRTNNFSSMSPRTKGWIKWLRVVQLVIRLLQLIGAVGILVLMILINKVDAVTGWVMRITPGVIAGHNVYAIYHLSRDAAGRTPSSSAAYQLFAGFSDLCVLPLYAFSALMVHNKADSWGTRLADQHLVDVFVPAVYYSLVGAGGLHVVSLSISFWLGYMFRKISLMPPDMNPLEDHLTARPKHKRNKSSVTTLSTVEDEKRLSTPLEARRRSGVPYEGVSRPPTVPFLHTRAQSKTSLYSTASRADLPSRQYQVVPNSPRNSIASTATKRAPPSRSSHHGTYTEIPLDEPSTSRPSTSSNRNSQARVPKFTETWMPTDSLISRTNQRNREMAAAKTSADNRGSKSYASLAQPYNFDYSSDGEYDDENIIIHDDNDAETDISAGNRPHPLRLNPTDVQKVTPPRVKTPFYSLVNSLSEVSSNSRRVSASKDIADEKPGLAPANPSPRNRQSSMQTDEAFFSRPYGELKPATPPVMVGNNRKISSGNDFDSKYASLPYERRNVSGKIVEEGRGGAAGSRFSR
ncbi:Fc.00g086190.m01.CDS01 [Cosmosporella sp. VM-42]